MTDKPRDATPAFNENAEAGARAKGLIVDYADAGPGLKAEMERRIEPIDRNPDSFEAVISYGHAPLALLSKAARAMIAGQRGDETQRAAGYAFCLEAEKDISLYLGAGKEVLRRYNEEYIPKARKTAEESGDPEDGQYFRDALNRKEDFIDRITVLNGARAAAVIALQQIANLPPAATPSAKDGKTAVQKPTAPAVPKQP